MLELRRRHRSARIECDVHQRTAGELWNPDRAAVLRCEGELVTAFTVGVGQPAKVNQAVGAVGQDRQRTHGDACQIRRQNLPAGRRLDGGITAGAAGNVGQPRQRQHAVKSGHRPVRTVAILEVVLHAGQRHGSPGADGEVGRIDVRRAARHQRRVRAADDQRLVRADGKSAGNLRRASGQAQVACRDVQRCAALDALDGHVAADGDGGGRTHAGNDHSIGHDRWNAVGPVVGVVPGDSVASAGPHNRGRVKGCKLKEKSQRAGAEAEESFRVHSVALPDWEHSRRERREVKFGVGMERSLTRTCFSGLFQWGKNAGLSGNR